MAFPFGALISGASSLLGGLFSDNSAAEAQQKNYEAQKEFAQQGIRWKVEDAKAAGIHPLYAMGAPASSFSPSFVGSTGVAGGLADAGQDIGRAIDAGRTGSERADAYSKTVQDLQLTRLGLENELLAAQIRKVNQAGHPPSRPAIDGAVIPDPGPNTARGADVSGQTLPVAGIEFKTQPWATAEEWERQYGDIGQNIYGTGKMLYDLGAALYNYARKDDSVPAVVDSKMNYILRELFGINPAY